MCVFILYKTLPLSDASLFGLEGLQGLLQVGQGPLQALVVQVRSWCDVEQLAEEVHILAQPRQGDRHQAEEPRFRSRMLLQELVQGLVRVPEPV